jgi:hypothetical protein
MCSGAGVEGNAVYSVRSSKYALLTLTKTLCPGAGVEGNALAAEDAHQADLGEELPGPRIRD